MALSNRDKPAANENKGRGGLNGDELVSCWVSISPVLILALIYLISRITNFAIVEITPIGIQTIGWKLWIVWTVLNALFLPVIYFFYPETGELMISALTKTRVY